MKNPYGATIKQTKVRKPGRYRGDAPSARRLRRLDEKLARLAVKKTAKSKAPENARGI